MTRLPFWIGYVTGSILLDDEAKISVTKPGFTWKKLTLKLLNFGISSQVLLWSLFLCKLIKKTTLKCKNTSGIFIEVINIFLFDRWYSGRLQYFKFINRFSITSNKSFCFDTFSLSFSARSRSISRSWDSIVVAIWIRSSVSSTALLLNSSSIFSYFTIYIMRTTLSYRQWAKIIRNNIALRTWAWLFLVFQIRRNWDFKYLHAKSH